MIRPKESRPDEKPERLASTDNINKKLHYAFWIQTVRQHCMICICYMLFSISSRFCHRFKRLDHANIFLRSLTPLFSCNIARKRLVAPNPWGGEEEAQEEAPCSES